MVPATEKRTKNLQYYWESAGVQIAPTVTQAKGHLRILRIFLPDLYYARMLLIISWKLFLKSITEPFFFFLQRKMYII